MSFAKARFVKLIIALAVGFAAVSTTAMATQSASAAPAASYKLTYTAGANGSITGTKAQTVVAGKSGSAVTAVPAKGYNFVQWSDGNKNASRTDSGVKANISVTATFAIQTFKLSYTAGANGTITGTKSQTVNYLVDGAAVTATPNAGYNFVSWSDGVKTAKRTDLDVTANVTATANFAIKTFTLGYSAGTGGSISGTKSQTVNYLVDGAAVTATPAAGYNFVSWSDGVKTAKRTDLDVTANVTVTANFAIKTFKLSYSAGTGGTVSGTASQTVNYNSDGSSVTATPAAGYNFVSWSDGVKTAKRTDLDVDENVTVSATFAIKTFKLSYSAGTGGTVSGTASQTVNYLADGASVTATPNAGYNFVSWSDGVKTAKRTDLDVTGNVTVSASFAIQTFTLNYTAGANGSITGTKSQTVNYLADGASVTATPNAGYNFVSWSDGVKTAKRTDLDVTGNVTVSASFAIQTFTLNYTAGANGSITGTKSQTVNYLADGASVTATPATGYKFVSWSDGNKNAVRSDLDVTANVNVTANFAIQTFSVNYAAGANGSISGTKAQTVKYGASATLVTATPAAGYKFVSWSDGNKNAARTDTNVKANATHTASFELLSYTVTYSAGANGSVTGSLTQTVNHNEASTNVVAVGDPGYEFDKWSDNKGAATRNDTAVKGDITVVASFKLTAAEIAAQAAAETATGNFEQGQIQLLQTAAEAANQVQVVATREALFSRIHARTEALAIQNVEAFEGGTLDDLSNAQTAVSALAGSETKVTFQERIDARILSLVNALAEAFNNSGDDLAPGLAVRSAIAAVNDATLLGAIIANVDAHANALAENLTDRFEHNEQGLTYGQVVAAIALSNDAERKVQWTDRVSTAQAIALFNECRNTNCTDGAPILALLENLSPAFADTYTFWATEVQKMVSVNEATNLTLDYAYGRSNDLVAVYAAIAKIVDRPDLTDERYQWVMNRLSPEVDAAVNRFVSGETTDPNPVLALIDLYRQNPQHDPSTADRWHDSLVVKQISAELAKWNDTANDAVIYDPTYVRSLIASIIADISQKNATEYYMKRGLLEHIDRMIAPFLNGTITDPTDIFAQLALVPDFFYTDLGGDPAYNPGIVNAKVAELAVNAYLAGDGAAPSDALLGLIANLTDETAKSNYYSMIAGAQISAINAMVQPGEVFDLVEQKAIIDASLAGADNKTVLKQNLYNLAYTRLFELLADYKSAVGNTDTLVWAQYDAMVAFAPELVDPITRESIANDIVENERNLFVSGAVTEPTAFFEAMHRIFGETIDGMQAGWYFDVASNMMAQIEAEVANFESGVTTDTTAIDELLALLPDYFADVVPNITPAQSYIDRVQSKIASDAIALVQANPDYTAAATAQAAIDLIADADTKSYWQSELDAALALYSA